MAHDARPGAESRDGVLTDLIAILRKDLELDDDTLRGVAGRRPDVDIPDASDLGAADPDLRASKDVSRAAERGVIAHLAAAEHPGLGVLERGC